MREFVLALSWSPEVTGLCSAIVTLAGRITGDLMEARTEEGSDDRKWSVCSAVLWGVSDASDRMIEAVTEGRGGKCPEHVPALQLRPPHPAVSTPS